MSFEHDGNLFEKQLATLKSIDSTLMKVLGYMVQLNRRLEELDKKIEQESTKG